MNERIREIAKEAMIEHCVSHVRLEDFANEKSANEFWDSLTYEQKCDAFHAVVRRIFDGEIKVKGSYRYVLYDVFGFGPDMYTRGMDCGYMALHNSIMDDEEFCKANAWMVKDNAE